MNKNKKEKMKLVAESLNEIKNREKLIKRREKLLSDLEKARSKHKKAVDRKSEFIEKYGEDAWWNNLSYYKDGYNAWKYERMRYPGKAAWNGEGPIQRAINNTFIKKSNIEEELKEIEAKLSGEQGETELMNDKDVYIPGVSEYDPDLDYKYAMTHPGYKGPPGGPYTNYYNDLD